MFSTDRVPEATGKSGTATYFLLPINRGHKKREILRLIRDLPPRLIKCGSSTMANHEFTQDDILIYFNDYY